MFSFCQQESVDNMTCRPLSVSTSKSRGLRAAARAAGSYTLLARMLRINRSAISGWTTIPARHVLRIERLTGVRREKLRPDLYRE